MKRPSLSPPDAFSISPLLALLPVEGEVSKLEELTSSLYARYEKVSVMKRDLGQGVTEHHKRIWAEEAMLKQVMDWLSVRVDGEEE